MPSKRAHSHHHLVATLLAALGLLAATAPPLAAAPWLVFTEVHYHPRDAAGGGVDGSEFVEILLREPPGIDLGGWRLTGEIDFVFPDGARIGPGERIVVARDAEALLVAHRDLDGVYGPFGGRLDNGGGPIRLRNRDGVVQAEARYDRGGRWSEIPDGTGHTLALIDPLLDPRVAENWAPSLELGGTPGKPNGFRGDAPGVLTSDPSVDPHFGGDRHARINEVVFSDDGKIRSIELFNPGPEPIALEGHSLSDTPSELERVALDATASIPARGFHVIDAEALAGKLAVSPAGTLITLWSAPAKRVIDALSVERVGDGESAAQGEEAPPDETAAAGETTSGNQGPAPTATGEDEADATLRAVGRYPDGSYHRVRLTEPTPSRPNVFAVTGDLVINEILYHPMDEDRSGEFVEIYNRSKSTVSLAGFTLGDGIDFAFADDTRIAGESYLVVAADPRALRTRYGLGAQRVVGSFERSLSDAGETIELRDASGRTIDRVHYADSAPWPHWADGLGASLELVHPDLDNEIPAAWAASDDSDEADWETIRYVEQLRTHPKFRGAAELQLLLLDEGECLIDDLQLVNQRRALFIADGGFERGGPDWQASGTHSRSQIIEDRRARGKRCLQLTADGRGTSRSNHLRFPLPENALDEGESYMVTLRARWVRGTPHLLTRTPGQGLAQRHTLPVPRRLGTPGERNSVWKEKPAAIIGDVRHLPVAPAEGDSVTVTARLHALGPIGDAWIHYRTGSSSTWRRRRLERVDTVDTSDAEAGEPATSTTTSLPQAAMYRGEIPPMPTGQVEFYLSAEETGGERGVFPADAPSRTCLYAVGLQPDSNYPTYTLLVSDDQWQRLERHARMSNQLVDGTLVYGNSRALYNVRFRRRGSPFTRPNENWRVELGAERLDGRRSLTIDGQNKDNSLLRERLTYWLMQALGVPNVRQQVVRFDLQGHERGLYEDVEKVDRDFLQRWFEPVVEAATDDDGSSRRRARADFSPHSSSDLGGRGHLHKVDDYFEIPAFGRRYQEAFFRFDTEDPEYYRWNFPLRANGTGEDYEPLVKLIRFLDPLATRDSVFLAGVDEMLEVDNWLRHLAVRAVVNDWDSIGRERGKNAFVYLPPGGSGWWLLPWDCDLAWRQGSTTPLVQMKFPAIERLLEVPHHRRLFLGYVDFLTSHMLSPEVFSGVLAQFDSFHEGRVQTDEARSFGERRREYVRGQLEPIPLRITGVARDRGTDRPDELVVEGVAPLSMFRARLGGREGRVRILAGSRFEARFPVGPDRGEVELTALNPAGVEVASQTVRYRERSGALDVPPVEDLGRLVLASEVERPEEVATPSPSPPPEPEPGPEPETGDNDPPPVPQPGELARGEPSSRDDDGNGSEESAARSDDGDVVSSASDAPANRDDGWTVFDAVGSGDRRALGSSAVDDGRRGSAGGARRDPRRRRGSDSTGIIRRRSPSAAHTTAVPRRRDHDEPAPAASHEPAETSGQTPWLEWLLGGIVVLAAVQALLLVNMNRKRKARQRAREEATPPQERRKSARRELARLTRKPTPGRQTDSGPRGEVELEMPADDSPHGPEEVEASDSPSTSHETPAQPDKRAAARDAPAPTQPATPRHANKIHQALAHDDFQIASRAFQKLWGGRGSAAAYLLDVLEDEQPSAIGKIRKGPSGLKFLPTPQRERGIPLHRLATLLLEKYFGKLDVENPTREDWKRVVRERSAGS